MEQTDIPKFGVGSVPVKTVARLLGTDECWVRAGIINGWLPIGIATRGGDIVKDVNQMSSRYGRIKYTIFPRRLWELTGYVWEGKGVKESSNFDELKANCQSIVDAIMSNLNKEE